MKTNDIIDESTEFYLKLCEAGVDEETASKQALIHYFVAMAKEEGTI